MFRQFSEGYIHPTAEALREIDTFLMGRNAYAGMASYWPTVTDEIAPIINKALSSYSPPPSRMSSGKPRKSHPATQGTDHRTPRLPPH